MFFLHVVDMILPGLAFQVIGISNNETDDRL
jgi:hypothetical protein